MKKLLFITALLLSVITTAQDANFITSLNKTTTAAAQVLSDSIISLSATPYQLLKTTERGSNYRFIYIPSNITKEQFLNQRNYDNAFIIDFAILEQVPGIKTLKLSSVKANYTELFPAWKKYFNNAANKESTLTDYSAQKLKTSDWYFTFSKGVGFDNNVWTILNQS